MEGPERTKKSKSPTQQRSFSLKGAHSRLTENAPVKFLEINAFLIQARMRKTNWTILCFYPYAHQRNTGSHLKVK